MNDSILRSSLRAFFISMFTIVGIMFGFLLLGIVSGLFSKNSESTIETTYTPQILANTKGVRKTLSSDVPVILKLNITGIIGADGPSMQSVRNQLVESREGFFKNDRVKGIILNIETPGGTVVDADGIYRALKHYKEQHNIPIFAFVDGMCASGGMYVASAADKIYASDVSLIGSVGVIAPSFVNISTLLEKIGVSSLTLYAGKGKDDLNPMRPWREDEDVNYKHIIQTYYQDFVQIVTKNRPKLDKDQLINVYGANIYPAPQAKEYGYIDEDGANLTKVLEDMVKSLDITGDEYQFIQLEKKNWYNELFGSQISLLKGKVTHDFVLSPDLHPQLQNKFLYLYKY